MKTSICFRATLLMTAFLQQFDCTVGLDGCMNEDLLTILEGHCNRSDVCNAARVS